jgi:hypothetical protein
MPDPAPLTRPPLIRHWLRNPTLLTDRLLRCYSIFSQGSHENVAETDRRTGGWSQMSIQSKANFP